MTPTAMFPSSFVRYDSPVGPIGIHARSGRLIRVDVARDGVLPGDGLTEMPSAIHDETRRQFDDYFAGRRRAFDLPLLQLGTPFQNEVWHAVENIPSGETTTYGALATRLGRPTGARAVGGAIAASRLAIVVPSHRVVAANGRIIDYEAGEGAETKRWLLRHELSLATECGGGTHGCGPTLGSEVEDALRDDKELTVVRFDDDALAARPCDEVVDRSQRRA